MSKQICIQSYDFQGYKLQEIGLNQKLPKALVLLNWQNLPTNTNIGDENMFAVIQEDNKLVIDIDSKLGDFNYLVNEFLDKTLVVKTGNNGRHIYLKDIVRIEKYLLTTKDLYLNDIHVGELKAHKSYVVGCGSSYIEDDITKEYTKVSTTDKVLQVDVLEVLKHLGLTLKDTVKTETKKTELKEGSRNKRCFKTACDLFEHEDYNFKDGLNFIRTMNKLSEKPLEESEVKATVKSAWKRIESKDGDEQPKGVNIYAVALQLMAEYPFITLEGSKNKEILVYVDGVYKKYGEDIISKRSRKLSLGIKNSHIAEIRGIVKDETGYHPREIFDNKTFVITLKNKTFNLKTGEVLEHSPKLLSRVKIPIYYDAAAKCPRFDKFLESSLISYETNDEGEKIEVVDERKIRTVLESMALCLIKDNELVQKAFMHTGKGSNGKSILFGILFAMLGVDNVSAKTIHDFEGNNFAAASLENVLANICADVGSKGIYETEALKKIISGDPLDCERKFYDSYTFQPYATLIFSANEIPIVEDESDAFARRFELIEWEKSFYGKDRDNTVKTIKHTPSEISGIFNKLTPIAKELLQKESLKYESTVEDAKIKWLKKSDSVNRFLDELCSRGADYYCPVVVLFGNYNTFAKKNGMTPLQDRKFNAKLEKLNLERKAKKIDGSVIKVWTGLTLASMLQNGNGTIA